MTAMPVNDFSSNVEENIERWAKRLRWKGKVRRVFEVIYSSQKREWTNEEIAVASGLSSKIAGEAAKALEGLALLVRPNQAKAVYRKRNDVYREKRRILAAADDPKRLADIPTKRKGPAKGGKGGRAPRLTGKAIFITIDRIDNFKKVRAIKVDDVPDKLDPDRLRENAFKEGIRLILNEKTKLKDWGGEELDLFTTNLMVDSKRRPSGVALKGPGESGPLTMGKMGKNGDQILRLMEAPIEVAVVQYEGDVAIRLRSELEKLARVKALTEDKNIYHCVIDLVDSYRLRMAYPSFFKKAQSQVTKKPKKK